MDAQADVSEQAKEILAKSVTYHDPLGDWGQFDVSLRIQEPRLANPERYSTVSFGADGSFVLERNRDDHISRHEVDANGNARTLLDGSVEFADDLRQKYRLSDERNHLYAMVYRFYYGLPSALLSPMVSNVRSVSSVEFSGRPAIRIEMELTERIFSSHWRLFIDSETHAMLGIELPSDDDPDEGERVYFESEVMIGDVKLPRMRHWHKLQDDKYQGSDIVMN
jgi:hypothetical protein